MTNRFRLIRPIIIVFLLVNILLMQVKTPLAKLDINYAVLLWANLLFFLVNIAVFMFQKKAAAHNNPNVFVRSVMGGMMLKMFVCVIAVMLYALVWKAYFTKITVFAAMLLYLIYLAAEVAAAYKMNKEHNG
ncbi:MAG TPA: hypothetical protein PKC39_04035 [Ferruginibacter sp.]|nr:hypothetical protein [Ferruginibacter sp.]HMP20109.1 hypothetical protein [Ferruginibacter sp.]